MKHRVIGATEFKAKCLALLDEVEESGGTITVTKRGRPVAIVGPAKKKAWKSTKGMLAKCGITTDVVDVTPYWKDWEPGEYLLDHTLSARCSCGHSLGYIVRPLRFTGAMCSRRTSGLSSRSSCG